MKTDNFDKDIENYIADILKIFPNQLILSPKQFAQLRNKSVLTLFRERKKGIGPEYKDDNGQIGYPIRKISEWMVSTTKTI